MLRRVSVWDRVRFGSSSAVSTPKDFARRFVLLQQAKLQQKLSQSEAIACVHFKQRRGRAAHGCLAGEVRFVACEMNFPPVASRMKEPRDLPALGINPSEVRALMEI